jgi:ferredoxin
MQTLAGAPRSQLKPRAGRMRSTACLRGARSALEQISVHAQILVSPDILAICRKVFSVMAHIVAQPCDGCRYTDCVVVCPVECFYEGEKMLYIHPEECIDCEACVAECPVEAIFHEDNLPAEWKNYIEINAEMAPKSKVITEKQKPLADS